MKSVTHWSLDDIKLNGTRCVAKTRQMVGMWRGSTEKVSPSIWADMSAQTWPEETWPLTLWSGACLESRPMIPEPHSSVCGTVLSDEGTMFRWPIRRDQANLNRGSVARLEGDQLSNVNIERKLVPNGMRLLL